MDELGSFIDFPTNAEQFSLEDYLLRAVGEDLRILDYPEGRVALTRKNPLLFTYLYLRDWLKAGDPNAEVTFSDFHLFAYRWAAEEWLRPLDIPQQFRDAFLAPRAAGKSTTFRALLIWALVHKIAPFIVIVSASEDQARTHISEITRELKSNPRLREDYPDSTRPYGKLPPEMRDLMEDRVDFYRAKSGIIISRSVTSSMAGMLVEAKRPSLIWLDDAEQVGEGYSAYRAQARLSTIQQNVLPLNVMARIVWTGTNQMHGSIADYFKRSIEATSTTGIYHSLPVDVPDDAQWLADMNMRIHWYRPLVTRTDGTRRSWWPRSKVFPTPHLLEIEGTQDYAERLDCQPWESQGIAFSRDMFQTGRLEAASVVVLSVDHARTAKGGDFTGISVVKYSRVTDQFEVSYAAQVHVTGKQLRTKVLALLQAYPDIKAVLIESPVGNDFLDPSVGIYHSLPVNLINVEQKKHGVKEIRYELASVEYFHKRVFHAEKMPLVESTLLSWPRVAHDDITDSIVTALVVIRKTVDAEKKNGNRSMIVGKTNYAGVWS